MPDYSLVSSVKLIFGRQGSAKTSFAFKYLVNAAFEQAANPDPAACIFIFDWKLEAAQRLGITPAGTLAQCEAALATRWVVLNPFVMFQVEPDMDLPEKRAFNWFCKWVFEVAKRGPGKKILFVDEMAMFVSKLSSQMPYELQLVVRQGRAENLELMVATQFPKDYPPEIRKSVTEWICFNTNDPDDLDAVRPYFRGVDQVADLPRGSFIGYNRDSGAELAGKLF